MAYPWSDGDVLTPGDLNSGVGVTFDYKSGLTALGSPTSAVVINAATSGLVTIGTSTSVHIESNPDNLFGFSIFRDGTILLRRSYFPADNTTHFSPQIVMQDIVTSGTYTYWWNGGNGASVGSYVFEEGFFFAKMDKFI